MIVHKPFRTIDLAPSPHTDLLLSQRTVFNPSPSAAAHASSSSYICLIVSASPCARSDACARHCLDSLGNTWSRSMSRVHIGSTSPPAGLKGKRERTMMAAPEDVSETETPALNCEKEESGAFKEHQTLHQRASPCCLHAASASVHVHTEA